MNGNNHQESFDKAIKDFVQGLPRRDVEDFRHTTLDHLKTNIAKLQARQHTQRRQQNLTRLEPFLSAIEQFGKVVSTFSDNNEVVAFVWGPLKFLLQVTSIDDRAFSEVLDAYKHIGDIIPLMSVYQNLLRINPHMIRVLALIYEGILSFQCIILRYFQQPQWQKVFSESWTTCKSRFSTIFLGIGRHRSLIESQATPSQIEETQESIQQSRQAEDDHWNEQNLERLRDVLSWLRPTNVEVDQAKFVEARADYPGTGQWLLENTSFKDWFHPQYATIPPLLWLNGIPGAGKTMLASLVVQKALELKPAPTVLYFYCKHQNPERDNFVALGRCLLAQFLQQDNHLLPTFYQKSCHSGETVLSSPVLVEELLNLAFGNCKSGYIILDGLDECPREQRKTITKWFCMLIESLPIREANRLRCLFISQDDGPARKDFAGLASIRIKTEDTRHDIEEYCRVQAAELLVNNLSLTREKVDWIARTVTSSAKGLFLLARLTWINLSSHTSIAGLEEELEVHNFPEKVNDAYRRIMVRIIDEQPLQAAKKDTIRLLGWLVCAKRPLKWHEIQVLNSINREDRCVAFERQSFIKDPKDLLASLIEVQADGSLEFCHWSVKSFLLDEDVGYFKASCEELKLATLCIDYLNLPAFENPPTEERVWNGDYGSMDYAVLFWLRHLEIGVTLGSGDEELLDDLVESLEVFINLHWNSPTAVHTLAKRHSDKLHCFKTRPFYDQLEQAVASTRQQLKKFGSTKSEEYALDLASMVYDVRKLLEDIVSCDMEQKERQMIETRYGINVFKCPRFSCHFFTTGFLTADERDKHISKHERPFRCSDVACVGYTFGFSSKAEREKHMRENHFEAAIEDDEYPTQEEIDRSISNRRNAAGTGEVSNDLTIDDGTGDAASAGWDDLVLGVNSGMGPQYQRQLKRARQTEFKCPHCSLVYKKRYNLQSHLLSHDSERTHVCEICSLGFARQTDLRRHSATHTGNKGFVCGGSLGSGATWGCGRSFARADTLKKHHESRKGRMCIQPLREEEESGLSGVPDERIA